MKGIQLPFYDSQQSHNKREIENSNEEIDSKRSTTTKIVAKKCFTSTSFEQKHARHPFFYQLQYLSKIEGLELPEEISQKIFNVKLLSLQENFNFYDFLQVCSAMNCFHSHKNGFSFEKDSFGASELSFSLSSILDNGIRERLNDFCPEVNVKKFEDLIRNSTLSQQEISSQIAQLINSRKKSQSKVSFSTEKTDKNSRVITESSSNIKPDYKLPPFRTKSLNALPKQLKSQVIEFLERNSDKPYPAAILSLMYFYGIEDFIQQSKQLGSQYLKNAAEYKYFDLAQSIKIGLDQGSAILADLIFVILNCADRSGDSQLLNDDLPIYFGSSFIQQMNINLFARLDQEEQPTERLMSVFQKWESQQIKDGKAEKINNEFSGEISKAHKILMEALQNLVKSNQSNNSGENLQTQSNVNTCNQSNKRGGAEETAGEEKNTIIEATATEFINKIGNSSTQIIDLPYNIKILCSAADNLHIKAFSKLASILYKNYFQLDQVTKQKLLTYLQKGCDLLIPSCMKIQVQLKIMGDPHYIDYSGAYQMMKDLFFLGSNCFQYDLIRLAKHYKEYDFLASYCEYLKNSGDKNIDILQGLFLEKGYGMRQNLKKAEDIYQNIVEKSKSDKQQKFDVSLVYRIGKVLLAQNKLKESQQHFSQIINHSQKNFQKLDLISLYKVGKMYEKGIGIDKNLKKADEIYQYIYHFDKSRLFQASQIHFGFSPKQKENTRELRQINTLSTKSIAFSSNSDKLSETLISEENQPLAATNREKIRSNEMRLFSFVRRTETKKLEVYLGQKEKMWECITKQLTVKKRIDNLKYIPKAKIEEDDTSFDFEDYDEEQNGLDTHYFKNSHCKSSLTLFRVEKIYN